MRRIEAGYARPGYPQKRAEQTGIDATLGAMTVQDVRLQLLDETVSSVRGGDVAGTDVALHRRAVDAERQLVRNLVEQFRFVFAAGGGVADDAHRMTGRHLCVGEIANVPEDAADGRAEAVHDPERFGHVAHAGGQNRRSRT